MTIIKWGILGTGNIAHSFAKDFKYSKGCVIKAVGSRIINSAQLFADNFSIEKAYGSYEELYNDPQIDVIYIATPHNFHLKNASDAMNHGKAVLCEKPITVGPEECNRLIEIARQNNVFLMEAMWTYFLPAVRQALEWVENGVVGKIESVKADFGFKANYNPKSRLFNPKLAGGALLDIGIYPIAMALLIADEIPENIQLDAIMDKYGIDYEETMRFEYQNGIIADLRSSITTKLSNEAIIQGEIGTIRIPEFYKAKEASLYDKHGHLLKKCIDGRTSVGYNFEIDEVNTNIKNGELESNIMPLETSMRMQEIMSLVKDQF